MTQPTPAEYPLKAWGVEYCTVPDDGRGFELCGDAIFDSKAAAEMKRDELLKWSEESGVTDKCVVVELTIDRAEVPS